LNRKLQYPLFNTYEAAAFLAIEPMTLKQSRHTGELFNRRAPKFLKMGRTVRYRLSTLETYLAQFPELANTAQRDELDS